MKNCQKSPRFKKLLIGMGIYAVVFIALVAVGLTFFWDFIASYEKSQLKNIIDTYIAQLDIADMQDDTTNLIASIDSAIQSEEDCMQIITDAVSGGISYARKLSECTDDQTVYMLMSGGKTIGRVILTAQEKDAYGFATWQVTEESFDFSFLLGEATSVTVPQDYSVYANGTKLDDSYIVRRDTPFAMLADYYADYTLPYMVTYEVAPILGDIEITIENPTGNPVTQEEAMDEALVLNNCTEEEIAQLDKFTEDYLASYARFSTNSGGKLQENYRDVLSYIVPGGPLADRMTDALGALEWVRNRTTKLNSVTTHHRIRFPDGQYLFDVTYEVTVKRFDEVFIVTDNVRLILTQTENGLKVEKMTNY